MLPGANLRKGAFHATRIVDESMLGPHATLKLGDTQHFIFREGEQCLFDCRFSGAELVGKTKGLKQILMERGLWKDGMTLKGPVIDGIVRHDLSAREVLAMQKDFLEEPSILEEIVRARGHLLRVTPICHPEIAGEGVEYNWGMSKRHYGGIEERKRSTTLANKHQLFHVCASLAHVTPVHSRRFICKVNEYKRMYMQLESIMNSDTAGSSAESANVENTLVQPSRKQQMERLVKVQKQHRDCGRMDGRFIKDVCKELERECSQFSCNCYVCRTSNACKCRFEKFSYSHATSCSAHHSSRDATPLTVYEDRS